MTTWTPFTLAVVLNALPSDMEQLRQNWVTAHPEKANRLAEIVEETRRAFRDAVAANPRNVLDAATETVPTTGFRHALSLVFYHLGMEMGAQMAADADNVVTRAEIWLRMVENGGIPIPCDEELRGGTPRYRTPGERQPRPTPVLA
jgi:selenocysteine lyase/cysteine desulfurase